MELTAKAIIKLKLTSHFPHTRPNPPRSNPKTPPPPLSSSLALSDYVIYAKLIVTREQKNQLNLH